MPSGRNGFKRLMGRTRVSTFHPKPPLDFPVLQPPGCATQPMAHSHFYNPGILAHMPALARPRVVSVTFVTF